MVIMLFIIVLLVIALIAASILKNIVHGRIDRTTVPDLDLKRYMGTWYEIARLENRFERGMIAVKAQYRLLDDGTVEVVNSGVCPTGGERKISVGRARKGSCPGQFRVSFAGVFSSDYNIMELGKEYQWALVGSRSASYLWILSRTPSMDKDTLEEIRIKAQERGYDTEQLFMVDQSVNQVLL